jgi:integrase
MLKIVPNSKTQTTQFAEYSPEKLKHHQQLIDGYLQSHRIRNHTDRTIRGARRLLESWFSLHGTEGRPLLTWEAMEPVIGRKRVVEYGRALVETEVSHHTVRNYLGILRGYFSYVVEHPFVFEGENARRLSELYGSIEQPVSEFDMPAHVYDGDTHGVPFDPARLYEFYAVVREHYLAASPSHVRARNYAMVVLAGETGLRSDELSHLEIDNLFFDSRKLQTCHAKATKGSGKRSRVTLFPPLARDTIRYYLKHHRPFLKGSDKCSYLFPACGGEMVSYGSMHSALRDILSVVNKNSFSVAAHMSWHWMRRLFATRFIERFPHQLDVLVTLLGHVTPNTVHAYIRHSGAWMEHKIIEALEGVEAGYDQVET